MLSPASIYLEIFRCRDQPIKRMETKSTPTRNGGKEKGTKTTLYLLHLMLVSFSFPPYFHSWVVFLCVSFRPCFHPFCRFMSKYLKICTKNFYSLYLLFWGDFVLLILIAITLTSFAPCFVVTLGKYPKPIVIAITIRVSTLYI